MIDDAEWKFENAGVVVDRIAAYKSEKRSAHRKASRVLHVRMRTDRESMPVATAFFPGRDASRARPDLLGPAAPEQGDKAAAASSTSQSDQYRDFGEARTNVALDQRLPLPTTG